MPLSAHTRSSSSETATSASESSYQSVLDRVLTYPGTQEIPLRTMYTLNCVPRAEPLLYRLQQQRATSPSSSSTVSPTTPQFPAADFSSAQAAAAQFASAVMDQLTPALHHQPSLPPSFITSFLRRCFPTDLTMVDFPQALTALDYLRDLEMRRRREIANALWKLGVEKGTLGLESDGLSRKYPGVAEWVRTAEEKERKIEVFYTQLYVGLRRWILVNELSLLPFSKYNCVAMLNTLYPPALGLKPTSRLTPAVLTCQRDGFFRYIQAVERRGPGVLESLINYGRRPGDDNGWPAIKEVLEMYLHLTNGIIEDCAGINDPEHFFSSRYPEKRKERRPDTRGTVSSIDRPQSKDDTVTRPIVVSRPSTTVHVERTPYPSGSRLGRFAQRLRSRSKPEAEEVIIQRHKPPQPQPQTQPLRKKKSLGVMLASLSAAT